MNIIYNISLDDEHVTIVTAKCQLPLFGRWCEMDVTSYCLRVSEWSNAETAITFGIRPLANRDLRGKSSQATIDGCLRMARGTRDSGRGRQEFEQVITIPNIIGQFLDRSQLDGGGVPAGRTVVDAILRKTESIVETCRQSIRKNLGRDVQDEALQVLSDRYSQITSDTVTEFLGKIDWRLLLAKASCDEDTLSVIEYATQHNPPRFYDVSDDCEVDIPLIIHAPLNRFDRTTLANLKATSLLRSICGTKLGKEFDESGKITVEEGGYTFEIQPGQFVKCTDPNGKTAQLCIHTVSFQCNPIDEIIIAYLHIKHKLADYMRVAIAHGAQQGFKKKVTI